MSDFDKDDETQGREGTGTGSAGGARRPKMVDIAPLSVLAERQMRRELEGLAAIAPFAESPAAEDQSMRQEAGFEQDNAGGLNQEIHPFIDDNDGMAPRKISSKWQVISEADRDLAASNANKNQNKLQNKLKSKMSMPAPGKAQHKQKHDVQYQIKLTPEPARPSIAPPTPTPPR